ncbi:hypothetical protein Dtox_3250 [Desulfofarcimen acetoxidans DSM 771]|uniref:Type II secretion system protein GspC N-terminal domain-containing protein n=1 Tax=Desulfofarcimen acetoxidans (strain ATCC 49208 / DSM 771 / KCTC 5769 / VKM B-1644 / 5575) TaxID=485916 RepID=C8W5I5_DESAS|nr:hypothetical protein [Desulfofarcimen acetoxidans]ACV63985.1 hypothetical protein Dtox_3250 [Desulfofarcimen acetoxidans DSM 771]
MKFLKKEIDKEILLKYVTENKKKLLTGVGIVVVLIFALIFVKVKFYGEPSQNTPVTGINPKDVSLDKMYNYLPASKRTIKEQSQGEDPFSGGMTLQGIISGGEGGDLAIIQSGGAVYIVSKGMSVADVWQVREINKSTVTLSGGGKTIRLKFGSRVMVPQESSAQKTTGENASQAGSGTSDKQNTNSAEEGGSNVK